MAKDITNRRDKEHVDEDQNGVIVAGPEAHVRERTEQNERDKSLSGENKKSKPKASSKNA